MITITESADKHLSTIIRDNNAQGVMLGVKGGGCAGFTYEWSVLEEIPDRFNQEDKLALKHGQLCIQPEAIMFILNTVIDFTSNVAGSYLKIVNPNATSQCGCGESFGV
jgi:iron-sulfur cluster assembly accessory protein